ncbi:serine/arginine repetitive matrix protein 2-like isoform X2 [Dermacentor silvarum]|uniref:serine/arginine repetitive matrix protein 2-like isoform X1 n=1 Tax=Dermacentor silvarum TaxID=543639 RepID=UPI002100A834|nr:serine/arginine repetitive matrix protein 2-like isoform X1 [Dermacentor silvarum]XP_049524111.1 serine/arginine repetitive matrix protein 2-like isoform X2 [Dermacentor silvarum]
MSKAKNPSADVISVTVPETSGQRVTRSKSRREKATTSTISEGIRQNNRTDGRASDQRDGVVTKTLRSNQRGKKVQVPESSLINKSTDKRITPPAKFHPSQSNETEKTSSAHPSAKRKTRKKHSPPTSGSEAVQSSSRLGTRKRPSSEKEALGSSALKEGRQDVQTNARTLKHQHVSANAQTDSRKSTLQASLGDAETSSPVRERRSDRKRTAQALPHQEPSKEGESSALPPTERRKSKEKRPSSKAANADSVPSSSRAETIATRSSSQEEQSLGGAASNQVRHASDNALTDSRKATPQTRLGDAKTSSPVCERSSDRKRTAQALPHHEPSKEGESVSAEPPTEGRESKKKRPSSEASNAEALPSSSRAKTIVTRSSSQKEQSLGGAASNQVRRDVQTSGHASNEQHTSGGSLSRSLRSRHQADGGTNPQVGRPVPEGIAGTSSQPPQPLRHKMDREKLRARPRHYPKRKSPREPVFVIEDKESFHRTMSPSSRDKVDASLHLSPVPLSTLPEESHVGKLGFHWYEVTFGALPGRTRVAELEEADDTDIKSLHWMSDNEWSTDAHQTEDDDSSDVSSGGDLSPLPWEEDTFKLSGQSSQDQEPGENTKGLDHCQKDARRRMQAYLPGVRVTKKAWDTIYQWQGHFLENMGQSLEAMAQRAGHDRIEEEDVVWYIHRYLGTADPYKLWALADELLPAELRQRLYPAPPCILASESPE